MIVKIQKELSPTISAQLNYENGVSGRCGNVYAIYFLFNLGKLEKHFLRMEDQFLKVVLILNLIINGSIFWYFNF